MLKESLQDLIPRGSWLSVAHHPASVRCTPTNRRASIAFPALGHWASGRFPMGSRAMGSKETRIAWAYLHTYPSGWPRCPWRKVLGLASQLGKQQSWTTGNKTYFHQKPSGLFFSFWKVGKRGLTFANSLMEFDNPNIRQDRHHFPNLPNETYIPGFVDEGLLIKINSPIWVSISIISARPTRMDVTRWWHRFQVHSSTYRCLKLEISNADNSGGGKHARKQGIHRIPSSWTSLSCNTSLLWNMLWNLNGIQFYYL